MMSMSYGVKLSFFDVAQLSLNSTGVRLCEDLVFESFIQAASETEVNKVGRIYVAALLEDHKSSQTEEYKLILGLATLIGYGVDRDFLRAKAYLDSAITYRALANKCLTFKFKPNNDKPKGSVTLNDSSFFAPESQSSESDCCGILRLMTSLPGSSPQASALPKIKLKME